MQMIVDATVSVRIGEPKGTPCTPAQADMFLKGVGSAKAEEFPAVGEGRDIRLSGQNLTGAALVADDRVIHLSAFAISD